ncbi:MAG: GNAT family N-acetyltransferase [Lyngbya sp.]|nr:GNAT family N-acetyltransferase [Lyngbya sp.]
MIEYHLIQPREIHTKRQRFRPLTTNDLDPLHQLWIHPQVRRYLWDDQIIPKEQTLSIIHQSLDLFETEQFGLWAVFPHSEEMLAGFAGFWFFHDPPELQLIYGIHPNYWGQGWGTESAQVMIQYAFDFLDFNQVIASADAANIASIRVMEKAGMQLKKQVLIDGKETIYYQIFREP